MSAKLPAVASHCSASSLAENTHRNRSSSQDRDDEEPHESTSLLAHHSGRRSYGHSDLEHDDESIASSHSPKKVSRWRWPSIIAYIGLTLVVILILITGFAGPALMKEYGEESAVFEPSGLSVEGFTSAGVQARVQGQLSLDSSRVQRGLVRKIGRSITWIVKTVTVQSTQVGVILPAYDHALLGSAVIPPMELSIRDGSVNTIDILCDLTAGDLLAWKQVADGWLNGDIHSLTIKASAWVPLSSGFVNLGSQRLDMTLQFNSGSIPDVPQYAVSDFSVHEIYGSSALMANVSIELENKYPLGVTVPSLDFDVMVAGCLPEDPKIKVAKATSNILRVVQDRPILVQVGSVIHDLPQALLTTCPSRTESPLDLILATYLGGQSTEVYVQGAGRPSIDTPSWIANFLSGFQVPVELPKQKASKLIREFALEDVHLGLPNPFSGPDSADSGLRISARVQVSVNVPSGLDVDVSVEQIKASSDIYFHKNKLGELNLLDWQNATSNRTQIANEQILLIQADIKDAPINITDSDLLTDVIQAVLLGNSNVTLGVDALVDVKAATIVGELVARQIPASGDFVVDS